MDRRGGFPPIVTVLLFLVIIAAASIVGWWFVSVHTSAVNRPVLSLGGGVYVVVRGGTAKAYLTLRNDGPVSFSGRVKVVTPYGEGSAGTVTIDPGDAESLEVPLSASIPADATSFEVVIQAEGATDMKAVAEVIRA